MLSALQTAVREKLARAAELVRVAVEAKRPTRIVRLGDHALEVPNAERAAALAGLAEQIRRELAR
jgi:hypothetical protein